MVIRGTGEDALGKWLFGLATVAAVASVGAASAQQRAQLTVYTALENDQLGPIKQAFEAENPGVAVQWVRDSTGVITARFMAEKDNPRADAVMGLAASSLLVFERAGLLEPYRPAGADALKPGFVDQTEPKTWVGMDAFLGVVCFNTVEAGKDGIKVPASWADLTQPALKGKVVMPHPASSGTGFLQVAAWLQMMGEEGGWAYMDRLHENIASYTHSGSAPCVQAAKGERVAGIALDMRGAREKTQGAPIEVILPSEGVGWDMEAVGIVKGTKNLDAARKLMDWSAGRKANELYSKSYAVVAMPGVASQPKNYPAGAEAAMIKADLESMAANRERILAEWSRRYESKAAPRT
jgi:iron(III) transport system substrate-binding protein